MKINWFSPLPPAQSVIALETGTVLPALSKCAEIVLWTNQTAWSPALEVHAQVRHYDPAAMPWEEINSADITVYHLGNDANFFGPIWQVSHQHPGIVVLHEFNLQPLFAELITRTTLARPEYLEAMHFHHPSGRTLGEAFLAGTKGMEEIGEQCPLTAFAVENALAVGARTQAGSSELSNSSELPVAYLPPTESETSSPAIDSDPATAYVTSLIQLIEVGISQPNEAVRWISGRSGRLLKPWFADRAARVLLPRLARSISSVFDESLSGRQGYNR